MYTMHIYVYRSPVRAARRVGAEAAAAPVGGGGGEGVAAPETVRDASGDGRVDVGRGLVGGGKGLGRPTKRRRDDMQDCGEGVRLGGDLHPGRERVKLRRRAACAGEGGHAAPAQYFTRSKK